MPGRIDPCPFRNSSQPPSEDRPKTRAERRAEARKRAKAWAKREGEKRKQGGQPGHEGSGRKLLPEDQIDEIVDHYPHACGGCGREFTEDERQAGTRFGRHRVAELPRIAVLIYEHRTHHVRCPGCGNKTVAIPVPGLAFVRRGGAPPASRRIVRQQPPVVRSAPFADHGRSTNTRSTRLLQPWQTARPVSGRRSPALEMASARRGNP